MVSIILISVPFHSQNSLVFLWKQVHLIWKFAYSSVYLSPLTIMGFPDCNYNRCHRNRNEIHSCNIPKDRFRDLLIVGCIIQINDDRNYIWKFSPWKIQKGKYSIKFKDFAGSTPDHQPLERKCRVVKCELEGQVKKYVRNLHRALWMKTFQLVKNQLNLTSEIKRDLRDLYIHWSEYCDTEEDGCKNIRWSGYWACRWINNERLRKNKFWKRTETQIHVFVMGYGLTFTNWVSSEWIWTRTVVRENRQEY